MALHYGRIYNGDSFEYIQEAINIKEHSFFYCGNLIFPVTEEYMTLRTPLYPLFLAAVYFFTVNNWVVIFIQNVVAFFNVFIARKIGLSLGYSPRYDAGLLLLILLFPGQMVYANLIAPDIFLQTCSLLYVYFTIRFLQTQTLRQALYMSLALVAGLFFKPVLYPFVIIHFLLLLILSISKRKHSPQVFFVAALPILCVVFYSFTNQLRTGKFHFSSIQSFNAIYYYQRFYADKINAEKGRAFINKERKAIAQLPDFKQRYDRANERGVQLLKENFSAYMVYHIGKSGMFFLETGRGELDEFTGRLTLGKVYAGKSKKFTTLLKEKNGNEIIAYLKTHTSAVFALFTLLSNLIKIIGVFLFLRYALQPALVKWFVGLYFLYFALLTGPISNAHYVMPVSLLIMVCALLGFDAYIQRRKRKINLY